MPKMKEYELSYYIFDLKSELWQYKYKIVTAKELAEFIIENAYSSQVKVLEIGEVK